METREIQILLDINRNITEYGSMDWNEVLNMTWKNYEDFRTKYGYEGNPVLYKKRIRMWRQMHSCGMMLKDGLISIQTYMKHVGDSPPIIWEKFKDIILEQRRLFDNPDHFIGFEYLAEAMKKVEKRRV